MFDIEYPIEVQNLFSVVYGYYEIIGLSGTLEITNKIKKGKITNEEEIQEYVKSNYEVE